MSGLNPSPTIRGQKSDSYRILLFAVALLPSLLVAVFFYDFTLPPFEDAAMLMRYAGHLAVDGDIVWNRGEAPVDGATDFLFMLMVAGVHKLGLSLEHSVRVLSLAAHLATLWVVFRINFRLHRAGAWLSAASVAYLSLGPGLLYLESYFGTPVFALAGLLCYGSFLRLLNGGGRADAWMFAVWGLLAGLIRPEGVFLAGAMLVTLAIGMRGNNAKGYSFGKVVAIFVAVFGLLGGAYFAWHWWYFGHPLPNPFYVKGGGTLHRSSLRAAILNTIILGLPLWPLFIYGMWRQHIRPKVILLLAPVIGFVLVWILMSDAMNYGKRFQYVLAPILMVAWVPVLQILIKGYNRKILLKIAGIGIVVLALAFQFFRFHFRPRMHPDGRVDLAKSLSVYKDKGYTMAITEAGNLPFYSQWRAIDTWGLNDKHIAHQGLVTTEYLDQNNPVLIMVHDHWSPGQPRNVIEPKWSEMAELLENYAGDRGYELVACYGVSPDNTHLYYLRRDFPDYEEIRKLILHEPYSWPENGYAATNFTKRGKE